MSGGWKAANWSTSVSATSAKNETSTRSFASKPLALDVLMFLHPLRNIPSSAASEIDHDIALGLRAADQHIALGRRLDRVGSIANDTARSYPYPHSRGPQPGESTGAAHGPTAEIDGNAEGRGSTTPRRRCDAKGTGPELRCEPQHDFETD